MAFIQRELCSEEEPRANTKGHESEGGRSAWCTLGSFHQMVSEWCNQLNSQFFTNPARFADSTITAAPHYKCPRTDASPPDPDQSDAWTSPTQTPWRSVRVRVHTSRPDRAGLPAELVCREKVDVDVSPAKCLRIVARSSVSSRAIWRVDQPRSKTIRRCAVESL